MFVIKRVRTCYLLCKTPGYYHSTSKTHMSDQIFKLSPIRASVIYQIPLKSLNSLNSMKVLFHLGKSSIYPYNTCRCGFKNLREEGPRNAKSVVPPSSAILFSQLSHASIETATVLREIDLQKTGTVASYLLTVTFIVTLSYGTHFASSSLSVFLHTVVVN